MYLVEGTVPSVVLDVGSHTVKAGLCGEDLPHSLFPSRVMHSAGDSKRAPPAVLTTRPPSDTEIMSPFDSDGLVNDWDAFEAVVQHALHEEVRVDTTAHAMLYAEPVHTRRASREKLAELFFERFNVPAAYLAKAPVLAAYASGKTTGIVLDIGHSGVSAVPVLEGALVKGKYIRSSIGGAAVSAALKRQLDAGGHALKPLWSFKRSVRRGPEGEILEASAEEVACDGVSPSYTDFAVTKALEEVKAGVCKARDSARPDPNAAMTLPELTWELPDGNVIRLGMDRFDAVESTLFNYLPHLALANDGDQRHSYVQRMVRNVDANGMPSSGPRVSNGLHGLVLDAIQLCDQSTHRDMYAGVCLTGGSSTIPGVYERISVGLTERYPKVRVSAAIGNMERKYCAWTGGSILGTFSEFQKMWMSKSEYMESGASFIHRRE